MVPATLSRGVSTDQKPNVARTVSSVTVTPSSSFTPSGASRIFHRPSRSYGKKRSATSPGYAESAVVAESVSRSHGAALSPRRSRRSGCSRTRRCRTRCSSVPNNSSRSVTSDGSGSGISAGSGEMTTHMSKPFGSPATTRSRLMRRIELSSLTQTSKTTTSRSSMPGTSSRSVKSSMPPGSASMSATDTGIWTWRRFAVDESPDRRSIGSTSPNRKVISKGFANSSSMESSPSSMPSMFMLIHDRRDIAEAPEELAAEYMVRSPSSRIIAARVRRVSKKLFSTLSRDMSTSAAIRFEVRSIVATIVTTPSGSWTSSRTASNPRCSPHSLRSRATSTPVDIGVGDDVGVVSVSDPSPLPRLTAKAAKAATPADHDGDRRARSPVVASTSIRTRRPVAASRSRRRERAGEGELRRPRERPGTAPEASGPEGPGRPSDPAAWARTRPCAVIGTEMVSGRVLDAILTRQRVRGRGVRWRSWRRCRRGW